MQPLLIVAVLVVVYGLYLLQKSLPRLYNAGEKKLVIFVVLFMLAAPLLLWLGWLHLQQRASFWVALPLILLLLLWTGAGYLADIYRRNMEKGVRRALPPQGFMRNNTLMLLGGILLWLCGAILNTSDEMLETLLMCISSSLLAISLASFWKYRKY